MSGNSNRNATLAKIHIAKKDLCLDDATYREILWTVARVRSARDLDEHGRDAVLHHFVSRGWKPKPAKRAGRVPHTLDRKEQLGKIEAQLTDLCAPWEYADAIAKRVAKVDACAWLKTHKQFSAVIAALETEQKKRGLRAEIQRLEQLLGREWGPAHEESGAQRGPRHLARLRHRRACLIEACVQAGIDPNADPSPPAA